MQHARRGLASLRQFVRKPAAVEICEMCAARLSGEHQHLIDPKSRQILCACDPCAILFSGNGQTQYRRIFRDIQYLTNFRLDDALWSSLMIPIGLVFFYRSSVSGNVAALYPSPAGATESALDSDLWEEIVDLNPVLQSMQADVEALLVNRVKHQREYYLAPIDECYRLTGLIRQHWSGFSGGSEVWEAISIFFADLKRRSRQASVKMYA